MVKKNINKFLSLVFLNFLFLGAYATHYRAGEIIFKNISGLTYEIIVNTYTDQNQLGADPSTAEVLLDFGDNTSKVIPRTSETFLNTSIEYGVKRNTYKTIKTYNGSGIYRLCIIDRNRVDKIRNVNNGNSVNLAFCVTSEIVIGTGFSNQSPQLLSTPIDRGCVNRLYVHNPSAYDPDGDSLVYEIRAPKSDCPKEVPGFTIPEFSDSFSINQNTGILTWRTPQKVGIYNIVIRIKEYRKNGKIKPILVGYVDRDMQIKIEICENEPPEIAEITNTCVIAGTLIQKNISVQDLDANNKVTLTASGGPFVQKNNPAFTNPTVAIGNPTGFLFNWRPSCTSIRASEFQADFKAIDDGIPVALTNSKAFKIKVIGPAPKNFTIIQDSNGFKLKWNPDSCNFAFGYRIYRRVDSSFWNPAICETGVSSSSGFVLIDTTQGLLNSNYFDNNNGKGLSPLVNYCYRVTSFYLARNDDGKIVNLGESSEGKASIEICGVITRTKPIITNVSVLKTNNLNGFIFVKWLKPLVLDSVQFPPPYTIQVQRSIYGSSNFINIGTPKVYNTFNEINNDSLIDSLINTETIQYNYKVVFYCTKNTNPLTYVDQSITASSVFITPFNTNKAIILNFNYDVPWFNNEFYIYKKIGTTFSFINKTSNNTYKDTGLINGQIYCYYIISAGSYSKLLINDTLLNNSQEVCGIPIDTVPPCSPSVTYITPCNQFGVNNIILNWSYPASCSQDVAFFKVYYKKYEKDNWKLISTLNANTFTLTDTNSLLKFSIAGCYAVTAIDSTGNESNVNLNAFCIDNCPYYVLPNVFTPNNDENNLNEIFKPFPYRFIEKVDFHVYNRWGTPVFETTDIDINWNGKDKASGKDLVNGTYFYIVNIYENYLEGTKKRSVRGTVTIIRE